MVPASRNRVNGTWININCSSNQLAVDREFHGNHKSQILEALKDNSQLNPTLRTVQLKRLAIWCILINYYWSSCNPYTRTNQILLVKCSYTIAHTHGERIQGTASSNPNEIKKTEQDKYRQQSIAWTSYIWWYVAQCRVQTGKRYNEPVRNDSDLFQNYFFLFSC